MVGGVQVDKEELELGVGLCGCGLPSAVQPVGARLPVLRRKLALERLCRLLWVHIRCPPDNCLERPCSNMEIPQKRKEIEPANIGI